MIFYFPYNGFKVPEKTFLNRTNENADDSVSFANMLYEKKRKTFEKKKISIFFAIKNLITH